MPRHNPIMLRYKHKAPKIPDFTCADIDEIIAIIEGMGEITLRQRRSIVRRMERMRKSNEQLRDSGEYWYGIVKSWLK